MEQNQLIQQEKPALQIAPATFNFFDQAQFETMQRVCKMFANSDLVPDMYKASDKVKESRAIANCMIAISVAMRTGADPLMIMQNMVIIYGRPSWSSKFLIASVNSCGRFNPLQYRFTDKGKVGSISVKDQSFDGSDIDNIECVAFTTVKDSSSILESSPISIEMAIKEGWFQKNGSKWQTMPKQMLMYRSASFWTNAYAPEISMGMRTEDEVRDIEDISYEEIKSKFKAKKEFVIPILEIDTEEFSECVRALADGATIGQIKAKFEVSEEVEEKLIEETFKL